MTPTAAANSGINWVAPTLFDAAADPAILLPLVLANAASPLLWELRDRILHRQPSGFDRADPLAVLRAFQAGLNRLLTHVSPLEVAETNGCFDLDQLAARLGRSFVETTVQQLRSGMAAQMAAGQLDPARYDVMSLVERGLFPAYTYATVDGIAASGRYLGRASRRPFGLSCCLDEVALLASLLLIGPQVPMDGIAVLASPMHYTLFGWSGDQSWWFYGKNTLLFAVEPGVLQQQLAGASMLVSPRGSWHQSSGFSSIPAAELERLCQRLQRFFGVLPEALLPSARAAMVCVDPSPMDALVQQALQCRSADAVRGLLQRSLALADGAGEAARTVLSCARLLPGADLARLLDAARQGPRLREACRSLCSEEQALALLASVEGSQSIFGDRDRLAMPEETLKFATGSDRDKALLLHVLLEHLHGIGAIRTRLLPAHSLVQAPSGTFCTQRMAWVEAPALQPSSTDLLCWV